MIAFVSGKRILIDAAQRTVKVQGKIHLDEYPWSKARDRVALYQGLAEKHARNNFNKFYQSSLAAAQRAAEMVAQLEAGHNGS